MDSFTRWSSNAPVPSIAAFKSRRATILTPRQSYTRDHGELKSAVNVRRQFGRSRWKSTKKISWLCLFINEEFCFYWYCIPAKWRDRAAGPCWIRPCWPGGSWGWDALLSDYEEKKIYLVCDEFFNNLGKYATEWKTIYINWMLIATRTRVGGAFWGCSQAFYHICCKTFLY